MVSFDWTNPEPTAPHHTQPLLLFTVKKITPSL
jgi:hypothetical protein